MDFIGEIRRQLRAMKPAERDDAVRRFKDVISEERYNAIHAGDDTHACPDCGSITVVRKGHDRKGVQRWLCKDCRHTFGEHRPTLIGRSKFPVAKWMRYVGCFVDCLPLRVCAQRCHVSLRTAWLMRMRLIECIGRYLPDFKTHTGVSVQLDETYLRESFKGNHKRGKFRLPRPVRHRGTPASKRGLSR